MQHTEREPDFDVGGGAARREKRNFVAFFTKPKKDEEASLKEGRPIFVPVEYVKIIVPGERDEVEKPVTDKERHRYPREYQAFLDNKDQDAATGTLLSAWAGVSPERVEELKFFKIRTVEQLAAVSDGNLQKLGMGARKERQRAQDYIEAMKGTAPIAQLRAENEDKTKQLEALQKQVQEMAEAMKTLQAQAKKGKQE